MSQSLGTFLRQLAEPDLLCVRKPVNPQQFDVTALLENLHRRQQTQAVRFEQPAALSGEASRFQLLSNLFATRERIALALGLPASHAKLELSREFARRAAQRMAAVTVPAAEAPVQEVVLTGAAADLNLLPMVQHYEKDLSPAATMVLVLKDPDKGFYDISFIKLFPKGPHRGAATIHSPHLMKIAARYAELGRPCPAAFILGHHPAFFLSATTPTPYGTNDYDVAGPFLGEPLRLTPSATLGPDFLVPADAEIVVEGTIAPGEFEVVDPFGEITGFYQAQCIRQAFDVTAITHRQQAIYQDVFSGRPEHFYLGSVAREGSLYENLQRRFGNIRSVHMPDSGCGRLTAYVAIDKRKEGEAKLVGLSTLAETATINLVIVVDADVDVFDESQVMWAVVAQSDLARDLDIIRNADNNLVAYNTNTGYSKAIIDATRPLEAAFPERARIPEDALKRMRPEEWT